jgi:hypothetical protein
MWQQMFQDPIPWNEIKTGILFMGTWSLACMLSAWAVFVRKDILS